MNPLKKGPEIKLPEKLPKPKVPGVVADVYWDLRDRHLLPLLGLIAVAIIAVPILLSESSDSSGATATPATGGGATASASSSKSAARHIVVSTSEPGLRNYHHRLDHLEPANPFKQQYTGAPKLENSTNGGEESGSVTFEESGGTEGELIHTETHEFNYYTYTIDVRIVPVSTNGVPSDAEPEVRHGLPELTMLPARKQPALVFMQPTADGKKALMLVNEKVEAIFGEGVCVAGGETCQLLALKPGLPETIVYGPNEKTFRIELIKVDLTKTDHLTKAPLGEKPGQGQNSGTRPQPK